MHCFQVWKLNIKLSFFIDVVEESCKYSLRDALFTACKVGDVEALRTLLQLPVEKSEGQEHLESKLSDASSPHTLLNKPIDASGFTLLHVATAAAQKAAIGLLLDEGADPSCRYQEYYRQAL